jgi:branched-chain amino acid transport system substrate-binding protein
MITLVHNKEPENWPGEKQTVSDLRIKVISILVCLVIAAPLLLSCAESSDKKLPSTLKIGAFLGLSGNIAVYGESQKKGIELAVNEVNTAHFLGEGREMQAVFSDTGFSNEGAVVAIKELLDQGIPGLVGPTLSSQAFAADPLAQNRGIPVIGISNTVPKITEMGDFIFRCSLPEASVIDGTIKKAAERYSIKKAAILWANDQDLTVAGHDAFTAASKKYGLEIPADEVFKTGDSDFKPQLTNIIKSQPDAICVSALVKEAIQIVVQSRALGFTGAIIGNNGFNTPEIIKQAGADAEGIIVGTAWNKEVKTPKNLEFIAAFERYCGSQPDQFAAQSYTSVWLYARAISSAKSAEPKSIRDALLKIRNFNTPLGEFSFTENREPVNPSAVQIVQGGKFVIVE